MRQLGEKYIIGCFARQAKVGSGFLDGGVFRRTLLIANVRHETLKSAYRLLDCICRVPYSTYYKPMMYYKPTPSLDSRVWNYRTPFFTLTVAFSNMHGTVIARVDDQLHLLAASS